MEGTPSDFDRALQAIRSVPLPHPDGDLLECFLQDSIDTGLAARYLLQRCFGDRDVLDLTPMLSDWKQLVDAFIYEGPVHQLPNKGAAANIIKRDSGQCCITGLRSSFKDPLVIVPTFPSRNFQFNKSSLEMLGAFLGPDLRNWMFTNDACLNVSKNYWLVRKSAIMAYLQGFFQFSFSKGNEYFVSVIKIGGPVYPSVIEKIPILRRGCFADRSDSGIDAPDTSALQILSRFAKPIRWRLVARELACKKPKAVTSLPSSSLWRLFSEHGATALIMAWRLLPSPIRIRAYRGLAFLGAHLYGPSCSLKVQQLPFGMYLKTTSMEWHESLANEYASLQLVRQHTQIPVPRALDIVSSSEESYLLTSRAPGIRLGMCIDTLSDSEAELLVHDLQQCLGELRAIPKEVAPEYAITNAVGKACYDYRINAGLQYDEDRGDFVGPFTDEEEFNSILRTDALPNVSHCSGHKIVFAHADLNMRNVLIQNGRLSGIVDWETSGWYPEYWDYTKAYYITKLQQRWLRIIDKVFKQFGSFESELGTETQLWWYCM